MMAAVIDRRTHRWSAVQRIGVHWSATVCVVQWIRAVQCDIDAIAAQWINLMHMALRWPGLAGRIATPLVVVSAAAAATAPPLSAAHRSHCH